DMVNFQELIPARLEKRQFGRAQLERPARPRLASADARVPRRRCRVEHGRRAKKWKRNSEEQHFDFPQRAIHRGLLSARIASRPMLKKAEPAGLQAPGSSPSPTVASGLIHSDPAISFRRMPFCKRGAGRRSDQHRDREATTPTD